MTPRPQPVGIHSLRFTLFHNHSPRLGMSRLGCVVLRAYIPHTPAACTGYPHRRAPINTPVARRTCSIAHHISPGCHTRARLSTGVRSSRPPYGCVTYHPWHQAGVAADYMVLALQTEQFDSLSNLHLGCPTLTPALFVSKSLYSCERRTHLQRIEFPTLPSLCSSCPLLVLNC